MMTDVKTDWEQELQAWLQPFLEALGHKARKKWAPLYLRGFLAPLERKSIQPMAQHLAPAGCGDARPSVRFPIGSVGQWSTS